MLAVGARLGDAKTLAQNSHLSFMGIIPVSLGFVLDDHKMKNLGINTRALPRAVKKYLGGKALSDNRSHKHIIDFFGLSVAEARHQFPSLYQHVLEHVKPFRDTVNRINHRLNWWIFGEARPGMRNALADLPNFIATTETSKHRWFVTLDTSIMPDQKIRVIASADPTHLSILSSRVHVVWAMAIGGRVGKGNDPVYNNTTCFEPFPFPEQSPSLRAKLGIAGEALDAHRKRVLAEHPDLTLTGLYNVVENLKTGKPLTEKEEDIKRRGLVLILKELHDEIDQLTSDAYGWPHDLSDKDILSRLVTLNAERAKEEEAGHVRWLRPDYQIPRFGRKVVAKTGELDLPETVVAVDAGLPTFPADAGEATLAVEAMLADAGKPMSAAEIARAFKRGGKRVEQKVVKALVTLERYGRVTNPSEDRYLARRTA